MPPVKPQPCAGQETGPTATSQGFPWMETSGSCRVEANQQFAVDVLRSFAQPSASFTNCEWHKMFCTKTGGFVEKVQPSWHRGSWHKGVQERRSAHPRAPAALPAHKDLFIDHGRDAGFFQVGFVRMIWDITTRRTQSVRSRR